MTRSTAQGGRPHGILNGEEQRARIRSLVVFKRQRAEGRVEILIVRAGRVSGARAEVEESQVPITGKQELREEAGRPKF